MTVVLLTMQLWVVTGTALTAFAAGGSALSRALQGGRQSSTGIEVSLAAVATPALRIDLNAVFMNAQFDELIEAGGANRAGNVPTNVRERTSGAWATYWFTAWPLTIGAGVHAQGRSFANNANTIRVSSYTLLDAQASWRLGAGEVTLPGKNLTNRFYVDWALTANQVLIGMPRVIDASYPFRF